MNSVDPFNLIWHDQATKLRVWLESGGDINILDKSRNSLLQYALSYNKNEIALVILELDININNQNEDGQTALHFAAEVGDLNIVSKILSKENVKINLRDSHGNSPIWTATFNAGENYEIVRLLVESGADVLTKNIHNRSPVDFALQIGDDELVKILKG